MNRKKQKVGLLIFVAFIFIVVVASIILVDNHSKDTVKVGFIMTGDANDSGWNGMHYSGVTSACEKLGVELVIKENISEGSGQCETAIRELISEGAEMIILSSYGYPMDAKDIIEEYPEIAFYGISSNYSADNMSSYFGRMYQARYLAGIVAGMQTQSGAVGYVAAMPNNEVNRGINAFTLGVKSVNPEAVVYVSFTDTWENREIEINVTNKLIEDKSVDTITYHQNQHYVAETADTEGIYSIGYNQAADGLSDKYLTAAVWNWESLYFKIIREFTQGQANTVPRYWYGLDSGVVKLSGFSSLVDEETRQTVERAIQEMQTGYNVFSGLIYDNNGNKRCDEGEALTDDTLLKEMDWYVDGVVIYE